MVKRERLFILLPVLAFVLFVSCTKNESPTIPSLITGPSSGTVGLVYSISVTSTDPEGDSIRIIADWGDDITDTSAYFASGDTVDMPHMWAFADTFSVRLMALDTNGAESDWCDAHTVIITGEVNAPPEAPTIYATTSGSVGVSYKFTVVADDPDEDSVSLIIYWGDGTNSDWGSLTKSGHPIDLFHTFTSADTYYVTAKARDKKNAESPLSDTLTLIIADSVESRLKWCFLTSNQVITSPAIGSDGTIYFGSQDLYLYALNSDSTLKWRCQISTVPSSPVIDQTGTIYLTAEGIVAIGSDGVKKWNFQTGYGETTLPAIGSDGTIYFASSNDTLYALNPDSTIKWSYGTGGYLSSPSVGSDGVIYFGSNDNYLYAINPSGTLKWRYNAGGLVSSSPAIGSDGTIYFGSADNYLYALDPSGTLKWGFKTGSLIVSSPVIGLDGTVYVTSADFYLYAITSTGTLKWRYGVKAQYGSPALSSDGCVYVGATDYYLYAIKASDGTLEWKYQTGGEISGSSPTIGSDGTIYIGSNDYKLYAIKGTGQLASSAWPMFGHDLKHTGRVGGS